MKKIIIFIILAAAVNIYSQSMGSVSKGTMNGNKLCLGLGASTQVLPAGSVAFKLSSFKNFYFGLAVDIFSAEVNDGANKVGMLLISVVPEYRLINIKDKIGINISTGFGFVATSMEPLLCITPALGLEYNLSKKLSLELDSKYLITKNKSGKDINGNIIMKLNLNFYL